MLADGLIKQSRAIAASEPIVVESESKLQALKDSYEEKSRTQSMKHEEELNSLRTEISSLKQQINSLKHEKQESRKELKVTNKETESILAEELSKHQKALKAFRQIADENSSKMEALRDHYEQELEAYRLEIRSLRQDKEARENEMRLKKENMEKAIARQLKKADKLLVKAKGICDDDDGHETMAANTSRTTEVKVANIKSTKSIVQNVFN